MRKKIIIIGGGVAGDHCFYIASKKIWQCLSYRTGKKIGGLFCSRTFKNGLTFDHGSHFFKATGISEIDKIITKGIDKKKWNILGNLKAGSFFKSKLNSNSPFIDTRLLNKKIYKKGINEILKIKKNKKNKKLTRTNLN